MSWTIIVASSQADQLDELMNAAREIAERITPAGTRPVMALSVEDVRRRRTKSESPRTELLIVAASLPTSQSSPNPQADAGLALVRSIGQEPESSACILVSDRLEHYRAVQAIKRCEWLAVDDSTNYVEECLLLARKLGILEAVSGAEMPRRPAAEPDGFAARIRHVPSPPITGGPFPVSVPGVAGVLPSQQPDSTTASFALLEVDLEKNATRASVRLDYHHVGRIARGENRSLDLRQRSLNELVKESKALKNRLSKALADPRRWDRYVERWPAEYRALGERMAKLLWPTWFGHLYHEAYKATAGNVRLRFNLERPLFDGLWEAMFDIDRERPLMVQQTITRRARHLNGGDPFRSDSGSANGGGNQIESHGRLNVLVIKSDVPDDCTPEGPDDPLWQRYWASFKGKLPRLPQLDQEATVLRELERPRVRARNGSGARPQVRVDVLERPERPPEGWSLADEAEAKLKNPGCRYDIVHFAGHALFAPSANRKDGRGYLIFSGYEEPRAVPVATVAGWLEKAGVQLVYLSCCRSSAASPALEFARNNVPMTIGFHWDLDDTKAVDFARNFYRELLEADLKVCPAMRQARKNLYDKYDVGDPIWASPVLVAQPIDWIKVEGVLRPASHERRTPPRPPSPRPPRTPSPRGRMPALSVVQAPASPLG